MWIVSPNSKVRKFIRNHGSHTLLVSVGLFENLWWIPLVYVPQPCVLYVLFYTFPDTVQASHRSIYTVNPTNAHVFWLPSSETASTHELLDSPGGASVYRPRRIRVERDEFCDDEPGPPKAPERVILVSGQGQARRLPFTVTKSRVLQLHQGERRMG